MSHARCSITSEYTLARGVGRRALARYWASGGVDSGGVA